LGLGFKNPTKEDSYLKSATPHFPDGEISRRNFPTKTRIISEYPLESSGIY